jgi:hypothetical protein
MSRAELKGQREAHAHTLPPGHGRAVGGGVKKHLGAPPGLSGHVLHVFGHTLQTFGSEVQLPAFDEQVWPGQMTPTTMSELSVQGVGHRCAWVCALLHVSFGQSLCDPSGQQPNGPKQHRCASVCATMHVS